MPEGRGKRQSFAQQVGSQGEKFFSYWSSQHRLNATKAEDDIGIDFLCQVLAPVEGSRSLEGVGSMLGAQVKAVHADKHPRIVLDRIDAVDILRQNQATCLFGVKLDTQTVFFKFLDAGLMDKLKTFLEGKNSELTLPYTDMSSDGSLFDKELIRVVNPFFQTRLRIHQARQRLSSAIPGSNLSLQTSDEVTTAHVVVPRIAEAYIIDPSATEKARLQTFERGYIDLDLEGVALRPEIDQIARETQSSVLLLIGATGHTIEIKANCNGKESLAEFEVRNFGDETSLVHRAGLRLTFSAARKEGKDYVHHLEHDLFHPDERFYWDEKGFEFFALFQPGADLMMPSGTKFALSMFGGSAEHIGSAIGACKKICEALEVATTFALADLKEEEFAFALTYLHAFLFDAMTVDEMVPGFVIGPAADIPAQEIPTELISLRLPIAVNWKETGVLIWIECEAEAFLYEGKLCGFRVTKQRDWVIVKHGRFEKSPYPEAWFYEDWPGVQIGKMQVGTMNFTHDGNRLPFGAEVSRKA